MTTEADLTNLRRSLSLARLIRRLASPIMTTRCPAVAILEPSIDRQIDEATRATVRLMFQDF